MNRWLGTACVTIWVGVWLYATRLSMLDDALIHLRYAHNLHKLNFLTFDGVHTSYGSSSLLYVTLLSLLSGVTSSPLLPKVVSVVAYVAVLVLVGVLFWRSRSAVSRPMLLLLLAVLISPMAFRWMTDGMETGLTVLVALLFAAVANGALQTSGKILSVAALAAGGFILVALRVELGLLAAVVALAVLLRFWSEDRISAFVLGAAPLIGAAGAALLIHHVFGDFLPDTARAKANGPSFGTFFGIGKALLGSFLIGFGLFVVWLVSGFVSYPGDSRQRRIWFLMNLPFPIIVVLSCLRGQVIHGVRYFLWCMVFSTTYNILQLGLRESQPFRLQRPLFVSLAVLLLIMLPADSFYAWRVMADESLLFQEMRSASLAQFQNHRMVALDIGFLSYFSGAQICDLAGLVNGRAVAELSPAGRTRHCAVSNPEAVFLSSEQLKRLGTDLPITNWRICRSFDFVAVHGNTIHYLAVPPGSPLCETTSASENENVASVLR